MLPCTRGKLPRDVGRVRMRVVIVMRHIRNWNKHCSALIHLTVPRVENSRWARNQCLRGDVHSARQRGVEHPKECDQVGHRMSMS